MKIVLSEGYDNNYCDEFYKLIINKNLKFPKLVALDNLDLSVKFDGKINENIISFYSGVFTKSYFIVDVDTSRKWFFESHYGANGIRYLDEFECKDKEFNYYGEYI